jgi:hypothetical protein
MDATTGWGAVAGLGPSGLMMVTTEGKSTVFIIVV